MARDFDSNFVLKTAGILYVFQGFYKQKLGRKIRQLPKTIESVFPLAELDNDFGDAGQEQGNNGRQEHLRHHVHAVIYHTVGKTQNTGT